MCTACNCLKHKSKDTLYRIQSYTYWKCDNFSLKCPELVGSSSLQSYAKTRITIQITALHSGQLPPSSATRRAQFSQNLACPQSTKAKPSMGANKQTSQHRDGVSAAAGVPGTDAAADALAAVGVNCSSSSSSSSSELSAFWLGCSASVWAPTAWLTARRNCSLSYAPLSNRDTQAVRSTAYPLA